MIHTARAFVSDISKTSAAGPLSLVQILRLRQGRAHEFCGPARQLLALWALARLEGPVLWIRPRWSDAQLHPHGVAPWIGPERLIMLDVARETEALACTEEALRAGAVAGVVAELAAPPPLTPLRRLHLAAETGLVRRGRDCGLLALILTPDQGGAAGVESRWHLAPCPPGPAEDLLQPHWTLRRLRARMAPRAAWRVIGDQDRGQIRIRSVDSATC